MLVKFTYYWFFDGWDVYHTSRTNKDTYIVNGAKGISGRISGLFLIKH
jgi:hypothetical protein